MTKKIHKSPIKAMHYHLHMRRHSPLLSLSSLSGDSFKNPSSSYIPELSMLLLAMSCWCSTTVPSFDMLIMSDSRPWLLLRRASRSAPLGMETSMRGILKSEPWFSFPSSKSSSRIFTPPGFPRLPRLVGTGRGSDEGRGPVIGRGPDNGLGPDTGRPAPPSVLAREPRLR